MHVNRDAVLPPGLIIEDDFITEAEERALMAIVDSKAWCTDLARRTQHYGFRFDYDTLVADTTGETGETGGGEADTAAPSTIPPELDFGRFERCALARAGTRTGAEDATRASGESGDGDVGDKDTNVDGAAEARPHQAAAASTSRA